MTIGFALLGMGIGYFLGHIKGYDKCHDDKVKPLGRILDSILKSDKFKSL